MNSLPDLIRRLRIYEGDYHYPSGLLNEAADALAHLADVLTWQPMQTAPKDGQFFIALDRIGGIGKAHWCVQFNPHSWATEDGFLIHATHWIPLPELPSQTDREAR